MFALLLAAALSNPQCLSCHGSERLGVPSLRVDPGVFARSIHGSLACVACHEDAGTVPHRGAIAKASCASCHADARQTPPDFHSLSLVGVRFASDAQGLHIVSPPPRSASASDRACVACHDGRSARLAPPHAAGSAHERRACLDCHIGAERAHPEGRLPPVACGRCHVDESGDFARTVHASRGASGDTATPACADCHGSHDIRSAGDPASRVHPARLAATCLACHGDTVFARARGLGVVLSDDVYVASVHGGSSPSHGVSIQATCADCHGAHEIRARADPASRTHHARLAGTCGACHLREAAAYEASSHGRAAARGAHEAPTCSDCHGEHGVLPGTDPRSPTHRLAVARDLCLGCHDRPALQQKYGLPANRGSTYLDSYHGLAVRGRSIAAAVCTDCHGVHDIRGISDTGSTIHPSRRTATCAHCHEDATDRFAAGPVHEGYPDHPLTALIRNVYRILLVVVLGGMLVWILILTRPALVARLASSQDPLAPVRFRGIEIVQHGLLLVSFTTLAVTGLALAFPAADWAQGLSGLGLDEARRGILHRIAGVVLVATSVLHVFYLRTRRGRFLLVRIVPKSSDLQEAAGHLRHALGRDPEAPRFGHFSYFEKMEYWALAWGTILMTVTGLALWFPEGLPRLAVRVSEAIHFYEALLAVGAILIWHLYFVLADPQIQPLNPSIFLGRAPRGTELAERTEEDKEKP